MTLTTLIKEGFLVLIRLASYIVPKKKCSLIFQPFHNTKQFSGNLKSFILYTHKNYHGNVELIALDHNLSKEAKTFGLKTVNNPFIAYWKILRATFIIIDATAPKYRNGKFPIIQLWHGTGFKNIGLLNENNINNHKLFKAIKAHYKCYQMVIATSKDDAKRKNDSFGTESSVITGSPRNDLFFKKETFFNTLLKKHRLDGFNNIYAYTPTFRDFETKPPFSDQFWKQLNTFLEAENSIFIVKKHPWDKYLKVPSQYSHIKDMSAQFHDVQDLLLISDFLISDYSGIITDFALTNRPILLYMYDLEVYLDKCRTIYWDMKTILPKPFVYNEEEVLDRILNPAWVNSEEYKGSYSRFKAQFHYHLDGNSSKRILQSIKSKM